MYFLYAFNVKTINIPKKIDSGIKKSQYLISESIATPIVTPIVTLVFLHRSHTSPSSGIDCPYLLLSVGPCALEYTKMKTADHFWTDPSADELVQRHRIHGGHCRQDSPSKRPALCVRIRPRWALLTDPRIVIVSTLQRVSGVSMSVMSPLCVEGSHFRCRGYLLLGSIRIPPCSESLIHFSQWRRVVCVFHRDK